MWQSPAPNGAWRSGGFGPDRDPARELTMNTVTDEVKSIFGHALAIDAPEERADYLDEVCGDDVELRVEVVSLLAAFEQAGDFLKPPEATRSMPARSREAIAEGPGTVIGPYKLL